MKRVLGLGGIIASLVLMTLPYGAAMEFAPGLGSSVTYYFSYWSLMPMGFGNYLPLLAGISSFGVVIWTVLGGYIPHWKLYRSLLWVGPGASVFSWVLYDSYSHLSLGIVSLQLISLFFLMPDKVHTAKYR